MDTTEDRQLITSSPGACGGLQMEEARSAWRRVAFRLLTFVLLIGAVGDRVLRAGGWPIVGACAGTLLLVWIIAYCAGRHRMSMVGPLPVRR